MESVERHLVIDGNSSSQLEDQLRNYSMRTRSSDESLRRRKNTQESENERWARLDKKIERMNTRSIQRALQAHGGALESLGSREPCMRVGVEFQANIPELANTRMISEEPKTVVGSVKVWTPTDNLVEEDIDEYLVVAKDKFGYAIEQALGMLFWYEYNIDKALENMPNFCPLKEEWSMEDKVIFQQAFQYHGKNFQRIRAMLPEKPISSLVKYYYLWKRSYSQYSLMDKQARRNGRRLGAGLPVSNDDTDSNKSGSSRSDPHTGHSHPGMLMFPASNLNYQKGKQLPRGIYLNTHELVDLSNDTECTQLRRLDRDVLELKIMLQDNKQVLMALREAAGGTESIESIRPSEYSRKSGGSAPTKWSDEEIEIAIDVIRCHGKDCEALSMALESKTLAQCRNFFTNYKRKLNLPSLIAEYEIKNGYKLSRYGRQARELVENGGSGFAEVLQYPSASSNRTHEQEDNGESAKRPRFESQQRGVAVGYTTPTSQHPAPQQVAVTLM